MKRVVVCLLMTASVARADVSEDAKSLVARWVEAQNQRDFKAYVGLYDKTFVGVKRTSAGRTKKLKLSQWKTDRKKMFGGQQEVVVDGIAVEPTADGATVRFTQRYAVGPYADHGEKVLALKAAAGALKIVGEEMVSSTPGWEDAPANAVDGSGLGAKMEIEVRGNGEGIQYGKCAELTFELWVEPKGGRLKRYPIGKASAKMQRNFVEPDVPGASWRYTLGDGCQGPTLVVRRRGDAIYILDEKGNTLSVLTLAPKAKVHALTSADKMPDCENEECGD